MNGFFSARAVGGTVAVVAVAVSIGAVANRMPQGITTTHDVSAANIYDASGPDRLYPLSEHPGNCAVGALEQAAFH